jgi:hypothetical protein
VSRSRKKPTPRLLLKVRGGILPARWVRGDAAEIRAGWIEEGKRGTVLGPVVEVLKTRWVPILWDDEEDPDWHKEAGLWWVHGPRDVTS